MSETLKNEYLHKAICILLPLLLGLLAPSFILLSIQVIVGGISPYSAIVDILGKQFASGHNLFLIALLGLIPFAILSAIMLWYAHVKEIPIKKSYFLCASGLIGIFSIMIPGHISVWYPLYGPGRMSSTAVIAFLFIPFYCTVTMIIGLITGRFISNKYMKSNS